MGDVVQRGARLEVGCEILRGVCELEGLCVGGGHGDVCGEPVEELDAGVVAGYVEVDEHEDCAATGGPDGSGDLGGCFCRVCVMVSKCCCCGRKRGRAR